MTVTAPPNSADTNPRSADDASVLLNERVRQMVGASPAVIYTTEATGNYACTFVSENLHSIFGFKPEAMIIDPKRWPDNLHPQDAARVIDRVPTLIEHGGGALEYRFRHHDGRYIWIQDTFRVLRDDAGQPVELVGVWADVTERKVAQDALQRSHY